MNKTISGPSCIFEIAKIRDTGANASFHPVTYLISRTKSCSGLGISERLRQSRRGLEQDQSEVRGFSVRCRQNRLYIFEQLVSRSFSTVRLTLTCSVTPSPGTLQSQLSAIRMRVITRHSWLLRSTSVLAKFPRSNTSFTA